MLTILGRANRTDGFCDGISRRNFLTIGGMALGGIALPQVLKAEAESGTGQSHKAIINIYLPGGPSHIDMWDPKPAAPAEIRGEFTPIQTNVPGIEICELFPKVSLVMDKFIPVRSLSDSDGLHDGYQCMTGRKKGGRQPPGGWPAAGAWAGSVTALIAVSLVMATFAIVDNVYLDVVSRQPDKIAAFHASGYRTIRESINAGLVTGALYGIPFATAIGAVAGIVGALLGRFLRGGSRNWPRQLPTSS